MSPVETEQNLEITAAIGSTLEALGRGSYANFLRDSLSKSFGQGLVREFDEQTQALLQARIAAGATIEEILTLMVAKLVESERPIPRRPGKADTALRTTLRQRFQRQKFEAERPLVLKLGSSTHEILEYLAINGFNMLGLRGEICLGIEDGQIAYLTFPGEKPSSVPVQPSFIMVSESTSPGGNVIFENPDSEYAIPVNQLVVEEKIMLEEPLPIIEGDHTVDTWAIQLLENSLENIRALNANHLLPEKPFDVEQIFKNPDAKRELIKAMELCHILCGKRGAMSLIEELPGGHIINEHSLKRVYRVLNWLCVARKLVDAHHHPNQDNNAVLSELRLGNTAMVVGPNESQRIVTLQGGTCDIVEFQFADGETAIALPIRSAAEVITKMIGSQRIRHLRKAERVRDGHLEVVRVQTALTRTLHSYYAELCRIFPPDVIDRLNIKIKDFKLNEGDYGWWEVGLESRDVKSLPLESHMKQMQDYILSTMIQLCRADKWRYQADFERFSDQRHAVSIEEVVDYVFKHRLTDRIKGVLAYETPNETIEIEVDIPKERDKFLEWATGIIGKRARESKVAFGHMVLKAMEICTRSLESGIEIKKRVIHPIPEGLANICATTFERHHYLVIEKLADLDFLRAAHYKRENIYVLWSDTLIKDRLVRIAFDATKREFIINIYGRKGKLLRTLRGLVASNVSDIGVRQVPSTVEGDFQQYLWSHLPTEIITQLESAEDTENLISHTGIPVERIEGKPVVVVVDPITGRLVLSLDLLERAQERDFKGKVGWDWDLGKLAQMANEGFSVDSQLFCPCCWHSDKNKKSAHLYPVDGRIFCWVCGTIWLPRPQGEILAAPPVPKDDIIYFQGTSADKSRVNKKTFAIARFCLEKSPLAQEYLTRRGLDWHEGEYGYLPAELSNLLCDCADDAELAQIPKRTLAVNLPKYGEQIRQVLENFIPSYALDKIIKLLTWGYLQEAKGRAVFRKTEEDPSKDRPSEDRLPERILMPLYWPNNSRKPAISGIYGRAITTREGVSLATLPDHYKVPVRKGRTRIEEEVEKDGVTVTESRWVWRTPVGYWVGQDSNAFFENVNLTKTVIVCEAALDALALSRMIPALKNSCIAICGTGHANLPAFLKWLGVEKVILATDFDPPGRKTYGEISDLLAEHKIAVVDVIDYLEQAIPGIREEIGTGVDKESKIKDLNAILLERGRQYAYKPK